jgi:hypothetical protein
MDSRVPDRPDFFDHPVYLAQNPPEAVLAAATADPSVEVHLQEIEEEVEEEDLQEYLAMEDDDKA